jgi:hypothetical protein
MWIIWICKCMWVVIVTAHGTTNIKSKITCLDIFLSLSCYFLLEARWWQPYCWRCSLPLWQAHKLRHIVTYTVFLLHGNPRDTWIPNRIWRDTGTEIFETHKPGNVPCRSGRKRSLTYNVPTTVGSCVAPNSRTTCFHSLCTLSTFTSKQGSPNPRSAMFL